MKAPASRIDRADLLRLFEKEDEANWEILAGLIGFESPIRKDRRKRRAPVELQQLPAQSYQPATDVHQSESPPVQPTAPCTEPIFWRVVARNNIETPVNTEGPLWWREAQLVGRRREQPVSIPPRERALLHWPRMLGFLRQHSIVLQPSTAPDECKLVRQVASGRFLASIPRRVYRRWPQQLVVLLENSEALYPLRLDFRQLAARLRALLGVRLKLISLESIEGRLSSDYPALLEDAGLTPEAAAAARWLLLSDLGAAEKDSGRQAAWRDFIIWLNALPLKTPALALVTAPVSQWWQGLPVWVRAAAWDCGRPLRLCRSKLPAAPAERDPARMLAILSMAVTAQPRLLRKLRLLLPAADQDVGCEIAVWNHPHVLRTLPDCFIHPAWKREHQRSFRQLPQALRKKTLRTIAEDHTGAMAYVRDQERILHNALQAIDEDQTGFLGDAIYTLMQSKSEVEDRQRLLRWARQVIDSTDPLMIEANAQLGALEAALNSQEAGTDEMVRSPRHGRFEYIFSNRPEQEYQLRQQGMGFMAVPAGSSEQVSTGSPLAELRSRDNEILIDPELQTGFWRSGIAPDWAHDWGQDEFGLWVAFRIESKSGESVTQRLRWIEPGSFMMGSPAEEAKREYNETLHKVILTQSYWLADTATTQALWAAVTGENPSRFKGAERPVEQVSWEEVTNFITRLNEQLPGLEMRLPTEAEWEYACRAGTQTPFWFGENITTDQVNFCGDYPYVGERKGEYRQETVDVRALPSNGWGLFQMHGNVWEWCSDWYGKYLVKPVEDSQGPESGERRVLRGGGWNAGGRYVRSAQRDHNAPGGRDGDIGFRLARGQHGAEPAGPPAARQRERRAAAGRPSVAPVPRLGMGVVAKPPLDAAARQPIVISSDCERLLLEPTTKPDWAEAIGRDRYGLFTEFSVQEVSQRMRWINPGRFMMGSPPDEAERLNNETQHEVVLSQGFWLAETACTQALWQAVMENNPSHFKGTERPVEQVSWDKRMRWIARLNEKVPGLDMRLPTEAEWEYACRAGTTTPFWFGENITTDQVNYQGTAPYAGGESGEYREETVDNKALPCNDWGLYQMHGNVWEWCSDWYGEYPMGSVKDPQGPESGEGRVLRGGSWSDDGRVVRSARRNHSTPGDRDGGIGFRLARGQSGSGWDGQAPRSGDGQSQQGVWSKLRGLFNPKKR